MQPLYAHIDVERAIQQVVPVPYGKEIDVTRSVRFRFIEAGHILGSAMVHLTAAGPDRDRTLSFSGDMGRRGLPILKPTGDSPAGGRAGLREHLRQPPAPLVRGDGGEALRGDPRHDRPKDGKVLIPAFSLGRTQLIIHVLQHGLARAEDSARSRSTSIARWRRRWPRCTGRTRTACRPRSRRRSAKGTGCWAATACTYVRDFEESTLLATRPGPAVIIASSGMCDAGRIQQHLKQLVDDPRCTIVLVSYQASGTVGRKLLEPKPTVRFQGRDWNKWIEVIHLDGFSGHADKDDFVAYLGAAGGEGGQGAADPRRARAGRGAGRDAARAGLRRRGGARRRATAW